LHKSQTFKEREKNKTKELKNETERKKGINQYGYVVVVVVLPMTVLSELAV